MKSIFSIKEFASNFFALFFFSMLLSCSNNTDKINSIYDESKGLFSFQEFISENESNAEVVFHEYKDFRTDLIDQKLEELDKKEIDSISFLIEENLGIFYSDLLLHKLDQLLDDLKSSEKQIQFDKLKKKKEIEAVYLQYDTINTVLELENQTKILFKLGEIQSILMLDEFEEWIKPLQGLKSNLDTFTNKIDSLITKF